VSKQVHERAQAAGVAAIAGEGDVRGWCDAVLYCVTLPSHVNIADIVVRPPKALNL